MIKKKEINRIQKLIKILEHQPGGLWIRELSRQSQLHPEIVRRIIKKYQNVFEEYADLTQYNINLKFIKLTPHYTEEIKKIRGKRNDRKNKNNISRRLY